MDMKARGTAAATAYLERTGNTIVVSGDEASAAEAIDILSIDGDTLVATLVRVRQRPAEDAPVSGRILDAALRNTIAHRNSHAPQCDAARVDVISILVLSEDRALLRHYRGERSG